MLIFISIYNNIYYKNKIEDRKIDNVIIIELGLFII